MYMMGWSKEAIKDNWGHAATTQTEDYLIEILRYEEEQKVQGPKMKKKPELPVQKTASILGKRGKGAKKTAKAQMAQEAEKPIKKRLRKRQGTEP